MSATALRETPTTIAEFDAFLEGQEDSRRWELVAGEIVAMTNPTDVHEQIVANIGTALVQAIDRERCHVFFGGVRVQRSANTSAHDKPRPDLLYRCGPLTGRNFVTDPLALVEVLSPSTIDVDRGGKLHFYKRLPTLRHVALVYQDQVRVELYDRTDRGWEPEFLTKPDALLHLDVARFTMPLSEVYFGTDLA